ncbi:alkaline phosphatase family protein [Roseateles asaccharophilus]|uniref:AlkP superfamily pyrophosphatase or phosphodiesterase n=1 Tax=Roseateles asaccharophilus TaxID=582607 RepID=A0ABU2A7R3_9BURK|nr:alkaline phosphatase family protein [Roseateles asaccharophilus]MDR7333236.1 putative AlkP superfamily pyrophosphatase or phosphodiesterase [Roseateles asaccharophilus]
MISIRRRLLGLAIAAAALSACSTTPPPPAAAQRPKLLVMVVIDGLPMRQVTGYRDQLAPDGFARFLDRGRWFANAHYGHGHTVTAAGHAVMLSGAYPQRTGIISNEWRDPATGDPVYNTGDAAYQYLDNPTAPLSGTSPRNLKVETLGDVLRARSPQSKVIGISGKDRGAILPAGHKGTAYMYMTETGKFTSSTYYMPALPQWVTAFNAAKPADAFFQKTWAPLLPEAAYARSVPDGQAWQVASGNGNRLPAVMGDKMDAPGARFYGNLLASPFGDELTLAFARAAVTNEKLGQRGVQDLLSVSLSSHDYINHAFGPESRLSHDHTLHLDRHLQAFFQFLDKTVGAGNYVLALTADHGFTDTPEWAASQGRDAGRFSSAPALAAVNGALSARFGVDKLARGFSAAGLLLNDKLAAERGLDFAAVQAAARDELLKLPGVSAVFTREQLLGSDKSTLYLEAMRKSFDPTRAAQLQIVLKPHWIFSYRPGGSTHGSPYEYDTHVPLLFWGPGYVGQGEMQARAEVADLAPTLAAVAGLPAPAQAQGRDLALKP